jgi:RHS repeat-associated protein
MIGRAAAPSGSSSDSSIPTGTGTGMALVPGPDSVISYSGYVNHPRSAMLLARHRWYQPSLGRWMSRDPAGCVDGMNLYA